MFTQTHADRVVFALNNVFKPDVAEETIKALSETLQRLNELELKNQELEAKLKAQPEEQIKEEDKSNNEISENI